MKTIKQWLETLEEPYRSQALANLDEYYHEDEEISNLGDAIMYAFDWEKSEQGYKYWSHLWQNFGKFSNEKSNRELAEMIWGEVKNHDSDPEEIDFIETILNQYR